ncbi:thromboxane-A synthase-like [Pollicipes pollicipes]|uniref:thromboxane-A synthase-like n=1 Tax=Pollicipes pollicipes TaxID=41117 RepID=UPI0018856E49|nr:thromboxane-A synthase-like [Pollicipes pollicipes]
MRGLTLLPGPLTMSLLTLVLLLLGVWAWRRRRFLNALKDAGVPGPEPGFFMGNVMEFRYGTRPCHLLIDDWLKQYGDFVAYHMGIHRYVVVKDLDLLRDVFIKDFKRFSTRPPPSISTEDFSNSVLQVDPQRWKPMRSLMVSCFSAFKMKQMSPLVSKCMDTMEEVVDAKITRGDEVDVHALFQALTCDVIAACALALKANCQKDPNDPFLHRVRFFMEHASNPITESAFAFPVIADVFGLILKTFALSEHMVKMINDNMTRVIQMRRQDKRTRYQDILQAMLDASGEGEGIHSKLQLTDQEIKSNALVLVLAGYETTANALTSTSYLLAKNQHVQEKLYQEISEQLPADEEMRYDQLASLPYLDQVLCESMRLYPPVVTFVSRHSPEPTSLGPYRLPAGTNILAPVWSIHHDPAVWPDPEKFDPDRFSKEQREGRHPMAWLAFGAGPRNCLGMRFGMLESKMALVRLVRRYRLEMGESTPHELSFVVPTVTLCTKGEIKLNMTPR